MNLTSMILLLGGGSVHASYKLPGEIAKEYRLDSLEVVKKMNPAFKRIVEALTA